MTRPDTPRDETHQPLIPPDLERLAVPVDQLRPYGRNPRRGDVDAIAASLQANGQYRPIVANRGTLTGRPGEVLAGNHTLAAATSLGWREVAVTWVDVDDDRVARIVAVDNRTNDLAGYDPNELLALLQGLPDLDGTGYDARALAELEAAVVDPTALTDVDDAPPLPDVDAPTHTSVGDVWLLGPHRLAIGDATHEDIVQAATGGAPVDLLWTDPPYGVSYTGGTPDHLTIANDDLKAADLGTLLEQALTLARAQLRPGAAFYVCSPSGALETTFRHALDAARLPLRQQLVWVKDRFVLGRADYHGRHESILYGWRLDGEPQQPPHYEPGHDTILYGWRAGAAHTWEGDRRQDTVWEHPRPAASRLHPTMKPVDLVRRAITNSTPPGAVVLDPFAGSGSTLIAAHATHRVTGLVELDPRYGDVIARRWQEHTGITPVRDATGAAVDFTQPPAAA